MTTKGGRSLIERPSVCYQKTDQRWKVWSSGRNCDLSRTQVVLLVLSFLLAKAVHAQGSKVVYGSRGQKIHSCKVDPPEDMNNNAIAFPGEHPEEKTQEEVDTSQPVSTTGQRVAGHLLAVLLLASVAAAIIEAVRARMAQCKSSPKTNDAGGIASDSHNSSSVHGATGRVSRRAALQEKSHSQESQVPRARSSSTGVTTHPEGAAAAAAAALAASKAQKVLRARLLGGRPLALGKKSGGTPPLLRRSSFPVMTRTGSTAGRESSSGSPGMMSRKQSMNDSGDDEIGDYQKRRVRIIRRF